MDTFAIFRLPRPQRAGPARCSLGALCVLCAGLLGLPAPALAQDITIGVIAGITGPGANYGRGIVQGAQMAVREVNAAGGINGRKVVLKIVDDASEPARSAIAMRRLLAASPDMIVGGWGSAQVLAHMDFAEQSATPYIVVAATHPGIISDRERWIFRVIQSDAVVADQLGQLAVTGLGMKRLAVIYDSGAYGSGNRDVFVAALRRLGQAPVEVLPYQTNDTDFKAQLQRIKAANPEGLAIFGTLPAAPRVMQQARELGITARFLGTGGIATHGLLAAAPRATEGTLLMSPFHPDVDAEARAWSTRYQQEWGGAANADLGNAAWEYRAIHDIAVPCLRSAGSNRLALRDCIANWRGRLFGVRDEAFFDKAGQLVQPPLVVEVRGGAFSLFQGGR